MQHVALSTVQARQVATLGDRLLVAPGGRSEEEASGEEGEWGRKPSRPLHQVPVECRHVEAHAYLANVIRGWAFGRCAKYLARPTLLLTFEVLDVPTTSSTTLVLTQIRI